MANSIAGRQRDRAAALAILSRDGGEMPRSGDEILKAD